MKAITSILAGVVAMVAAVAPQAQADRLSDKLAERIKLLDKVSNSTFDVGSNVRPEAYAQVSKDLGLPAELMAEIELYRQNRKNPRQHTDSLIGNL